MSSNDLLLNQSFPLSFHYLKSFWYSSSFSNFSVSFVNSFSSSQYSKANLPQKTVSKTLLWLHHFTVNSSGLMSLSTIYILMIQKYTFQTQTSPLDFRLICLSIFLIDCLIAISTEHGTNQTPDLPCKNGSPTVFSIKFIENPHFYVLRPKTSHFSLNLIYSFSSLSINSIVFTLKIYQNHTISNHFYHYCSGPCHHPFSGLLHCFLSALLDNMLASYAILYQRYCFSSSYWYLIIIEVLNQNPQSILYPVSKYCMVFNKWQNRRPKDITLSPLLFLCHVTSLQERYFMAVTNSSATSQPLALMMG